jgi:hypothetical protein
VADWISKPPIEDAFEVPKLPDFITDLQTSINSVLEFLSSLLDIALTFLEVVRAFAIANIDPIKALIEAAIAEVEELFAQLTQAGLFLTGDWWLLSPTCEGLVGGFQDYESRMSARFQDKDDPTRPVIPSTSPTFAVFMYLDVDFSGVHTIAQFLNLILELFTFEFPSRPALQSPIGFEVNYRQEDESPTRRNLEQTLRETSTGPIDVANVSWLVPEAAKNPGMAIVTPPPFGFLVTLSTVKDGLQVLYDRPLANSPLVDDAEGNKNQDREQGMVLGPDTRPLIIDGGYDQVKLEGLGYNSSIAGGGATGSVVKKGASRVYARRSVADNVPIPLELLKDGDKYLLQRQLYIRTEDILGGFGAIVPHLFSDVRYDIDLTIGDLPYEASFEVQSDGTVAVVQDSIKIPETVYVRVAPTTARVRKAEDWQYRFPSELMANPGKPFQVLLPENENNDQVSAGDRAAPGAPIGVGFPTETTRAYIDAIAASLALIVLSRADLPVAEVGDRFLDGKAAEPTGLEGYGYLVPKLISSLAPNLYFEKSDVSGADDMIEFRNNVLAGCRLLAGEMFTKTGPTAELQEKAVEEAEGILNWKWSDTDFTEQFSTGGGLETISTTTYSFPDQTILESLSETSPLIGVSRNPFTSGIQLIGPPYEDIGGRLPGFFQRADGSGGSADYSPAIVALRKGSTLKRRIVFARNLVPEEVYLSAATVLNISAGPTQRPPEDGQWLSIRLSDLIPGLDILGETIVGWLKGLLSGIGGVLDAILALIDFLEARILELQGLLDRINALLFSLVTFRFPRFAALVVTGDGTDGVLTQFLSAGNKPVDSGAAATVRNQLQTMAAERAASRQAIVDAFDRDSALEDEIEALEAEGKTTSADEKRVEQLQAQEEATTATAAFTAVTESINLVEKTPLTYSAGAVLVGGGLPSVVVELLSSLLVPQ